MKIDPSNINRSNINSVLASLMIESLVLRGVDYFCLAPGSRSTPLAVAVAEHPKAKVRIHFDERGAGFHALGFGSATGRPAVLIVTSGTAVANLWPAVVEASMGNRPMILLTADRPPELRNTGANQTIDQVDIFGQYTRLFVDLPCPDITSAPKEIIGLIDQAVSKATGSNSGPVHINCMFREPLAPIDDAVDYSDYLAEIIATKQTDGRPVKPGPGDSEIEKVISIINRAEKGLIVIGALDQSVDHDSLIELLNRLNWPVCCDITSGLRLDNDLTSRVTYYDQLLLSDSTQALLKPDCCLHFGGAICSKRLVTALGEWQPEHYVQIKSGQLPFDPNRQVTYRINHEPGLFCEQLGNRIRQNDKSLKLTKLTKLIELSTTIDSIIEQTLAESTDLSESLVARTVSKMLPGQHGLFLASSLAIREIDRYAVSRGSKVRVGANRGASGIDGTIACAAGFAAGLAQPVTLLIGDLATLHDLNSLALLADNQQPVTIVLLNNDGGRIFSQLPIAKFESVLEKFFVTPHGLKFEPAAKMFGLAYTRVDSVEELAETYQEHLSLGSSSLIEVVIDSSRSAKIHAELTKNIITGLGN